MPAKHNSDSTLQQKQEVLIIDAFLLKFFPEKTLKNTEATFLLGDSNNTKMQLDLYIKSKNVIGEVYVTELPFNSGRKRKFQSDILKMITFEKQNKDQNFEKYYFLTADQEKLESITDTVDEGDFVEHNREQSIIGKDTWLNLTLETFNIKLFYYCIDKDFFQDLKNTRKMQKEGMAE